MTVVPSATCVTTPIPRSPWKYLRYVAMPSIAPYAKSIAAKPNANAQLGATLTPPGPIRLRPNE